MEFIDIALMTLCFEKQRALVGVLAFLSNEYSSRVRKGNVVNCYQISMICLVLAQIQTSRDGLTLVHANLMSKCPKLSTHDTALYLSLQQYILPLNSSQFYTQT